MSKNCGLLLAGIVLVALVATSCDNGGKTGLRIVTEIIPPPAEGRAYSFPLDAKNGREPYTWSVEAGSLPAGMTFSNGGVLSGTPSETGEYEVTIGVTSTPPGKTRKRTFTVNVRALPSWTVMFYLAADTNIEEALLENLQQIESVGSTDNLNLVVQVDRIPGYSGAFGNWKDVRRYYVRADGSLKEINSPLLEAPGQLDMGNGATLEDFGRWAAAAFPAENYALVLNDHGLFWLGAMTDDTSGTFMSIPDMASALGGVTSDLGNKLDLLAFDACLMSNFETIVALAPYAEFMVASEESSPICGLDYATSLAALRDNAAMTARDLARRFITDYEAFTPNEPYSAMTALDLSLVDDLSNALAGFVAALDNSPEYFYAAANALLDSDSIEVAEEYLLVDAKNFVEVSAAFSGDCAVQASAAAVASAVDAAVVETYTRPVHPYAGGISIFFPYSYWYSYTYYKSEYDALHSGVAELSNCSWKNYIEDFYQEAESLSYPDFDNFGIVRSFADFSENTGALISYSATNRNVQWIAAEVRSAFDDDEDYLWGAIFIRPEKTLPSGQVVGTGNWTQINTFEWDGSVWGLSNGSHASPGTLEPLEKNLCQIACKYKSGGDKRPCVVVFDRASGRALYMVVETLLYYVATPIEAGTKFYPLISVMEKDYDWPSRDGIQSSGFVIAGESGLSLARVKLDPGDYSLEFDLYDLSGSYSASVSGSIELRE